jgi:hypothetical protein
MSRTFSTIVLNWISFIVSGYLNNFREYAKQGKNYYYIQVMRALLVNPWIQDFAAYNLWALPLGLLIMARVLNRNNIQVDYIDCLENNPDLFNRDYIKARKGAYGESGYYKIRIHKPEPYNKVPRYYYRFGVPEEHFIKRLKSMERPDIVLVTSRMTYWYGGVFNAIKLVKDMLPDVPVLLGGTYALLCPGHAGRLSGADFVISSNDPVRNIRLICSVLGRELDYSPEDLFLPELSVLPDLSFIPLLTSLGCPYRCPYCATPFLSHRLCQFSTGTLVNWLKHTLERYPVRDLCFYDDALFSNREKHIKPLLRNIIELGTELRLHAPDGLFIDSVDQELAGLMLKAGFKTLRFGLETMNSARQKSMGGKVDVKRFSQKIGLLLKTGFQKKEIGAYIMAGLPGQRVSEVEDTIRYVHSLGIKAKLCNFSPIPFTRYGDVVFKTSPQVSREPLLQNDTAMPLWNHEFTWEKIRRLKNLVSRPGFLE